MKIAIIILLFTLGCIQPSQFTKDCSMYKDISMITNCYKEQAYYQAAIGNEGQALDLCKKMYDAIDKADKPGFQDVLLSFDKTMADVSRMLFMLDNYNNCILNVARLTRDRSICNNIKNPRDILNAIPPLANAVDYLIPVSLLSDQMCMTEIDVINVREQSIRPFRDYIK